MKTDKKAELREVPLSWILVDYEWNCRTVKTDEASLRLATHEGEDIFDSIGRHGVRTPVEVIETTAPEEYCDADRDEHPWFRLFEGFRRIAISAWWSAREVSAGKAERTVPCIVRAWRKETSLREQNLLAALHRKDLFPCELAKGLAAWRDSLPRTVGPREVGERFGIDPKYAANLLRARDKASSDLLRYWDQYHSLATRKVLAVLTLPKSDQLPALLASLSADKGAPSAPAALKLSAAVWKDTQRAIHLELVRQHASQPVAAKSFEAGIRFACSLLGLPLQKPKTREARRALAGMTNDASDGLTADERDERRVGA